MYAYIDCQVEQGEVVYYSEPFIPNVCWLSGFRRHDPAASCTRDFEKKRCVNERTVWANIFTLEISD